MFKKLAPTLPSDSTIGFPASSVSIPMQLLINCLSRAFSRPVQASLCSRIISLAMVFLASSSFAQGYLGAVTPVTAPAPILTTNAIVTTNFTTTTNIVFTTNTQIRTNINLVTNAVVSTTPSISSNAVTTSQTQVQTNSVISTQPVVTTNVSVVSLPPGLQTVGAQAGNWATFTQGGWGAPPAGNNAGALLARNYDSAYPFGLEVGVPGSQGNSLVFSSSAAVAAYLPAGGLPGALAADGIDPINSSAGVLGGQVTALRLNVDFAWMGFLPLTVPATTVTFGDLIYKNTGDALDGMSVVDILFTAEDVLGGGPLPTGYTYANLNDLLTRLNESFDNGSVATPWAQTALMTLSGGGFQTNTVLTTNLVAVTNLVMTTNLVSTTNWVLTTNLVSITNLAMATNLTFTTNLVGSSNSVILTNLVLTTNYAVVTNGSTVLTGRASKNFKILTLGARDVRVVDPSEYTADDRGGIALAGSRVFLRGDQFTASYAADNLSDGKRLWTNHNGQCWIELDALCGNLATKQAYVLADDKGQLGLNGGTVTRLIPIDPSGMAIGVPVTLSKPIVLTGAGLYTARIGIFSGYNEILLHDGSRVYAVDPTTGEVELAGTPGSLPRMVSESWAFWGVAENFGGARYVAYVHQDGQRVVRTRVTDGFTETIATFTSLGDMASFTVDPERNRWYFHHEGASVLAPNLDSGIEVLGYATATFEILAAAPTYNFATTQIQLREDAGTVVISNFLKITSQPAGVSNYHFELEVDGFGMFAELPSIDVDGNLRMTLADDENGEAEVALVVRDERGRNLAPPQSFKVTVAPVNDPPRFTLSDRPFPTAARIGYYDMGGLPGQEAYAKPIEFLGHTALPISNLTAQALARLDVLVVFNPETGEYSSRYEAALPRITEAVGRGLSLLVFDRKVEDAQMILPGAADIRFIGDAAYREVINLASRNLLTEGPAGNLHGHDLDNGHYSQHGYAQTQSLPAGSEVLLTRNNADEAVMFSYPVGQGRVTYASIPLDHFLCNNSANTMFADVLAPNAVAYAAHFAARPKLLVVDATNDTVELPGFVDSINPGPWNEWDQTVTISVKPSRPELFAVAPRVDELGNLTFKPAVGAAGETTLVFQARDNGGGPEDTSAAQQITLRILGTSQDMGFEPGGDVTVFHGEGEHTMVGWAKNLRSGWGAGVAANTQFTVVAADPELFSTQPSIDAAGNLRFRTKPEVLGSTTVTVVMRTSVANASVATEAGGRDDAKSDDVPAGPRDITPKAGDMLETEPFAFRLAVGGTRLRFGSQLAATRGQLVTVPVLLDSDGTANAASATIEFDANALTFQSSQSVDDDFQAGSLIVNSSEAALGRLSFLAARPVGRTFSNRSGTALMNLTFMVRAASGLAQTALDFTDSISQREVVNTAGSATRLVVFESANLAISDSIGSGQPRLEGDVTPRGNPDGMVTIGDVVQIARFAAGLDPITSQAELNAADCAPLATLGDGVITVADYVQAMRFAVGLDKPAAAQAPIRVAASLGRALPRATAVARKLRIAGALVPGQRNDLTVELESEGGENGLQFTLAFDPAVMTFESVRLGDADPGLSLLENSTQAANGRVGVLLTMPTGQSLPAGTKKLVKLRVRLAASVSATQSAVQLEDSLIARQLVDANAAALPTVYENLDAPISAERRLRAGGGKRNPDGTIELHLGAEDGQEIPDTEKGKIDVFYRDTATGPWLPLLDGVTVVAGQIHILDPANNHRALRFYQIRSRP